MHDHVRFGEHLRQPGARLQIHAGAPARDDRIVPEVAQGRHDAAAEMSQATRDNDPHASQPMVAVMRELVDGWPFWAVYLFFFAGAMVRAHVTYAVGLALRAGTRRGRLAHSRLAGRLEGPAMERAERQIARFGPPLVTLSFLTVGVQTLVNAAAGGLRMGWRRYTPAATVGSLLWAALYTTAGFAVVDVLLGRVAWWWLIIAAALIALVAILTRRWRRRLDA